MDRKKRNREGKKKIRKKKKTIDKEPQIRNDVKLQLRKVLSQVCRHVEFEQTVLGGGIKNLNNTIAVP